MVINDDELIDVVDEDEKVIATMPRSKAIAGKMRWRLAVVFIFNSREQLFVHKRSAAKKTHPLCWDLKVGGFVDHGETPDQAIIREAKEEIGADIKPEFLFKVWDRQSLLYVYRAAYDGYIKPEVDEIAEFEWAKINYVKKILNMRKFMPSAVFLFENHWKQIVGENA